MTARKKKKPIRVEYTQREIPGAKSFTFRVAGNKFHILQGSTGTVAFLRTARGLRVVATSLRRVGAPWLMGPFLRKLLIDFVENELKSKSV